MHIASAQGLAPRGLPSDNIWPVILDAIADGSSLKSALRLLNPVPSYSWAKKQLRNDPELKAAYREAQQDRADRLAEQLIELADTPMPEGLDGPSKSTWVQKLRVQIDMRKWSAAKLHPRIYGERIDVSVTETQISITTALAEAEQRVITGKLLDMGEQVGSLPMSELKLQLNQ